MIRQEPLGRTIGTTANRQGQLHKKVWNLGSVDVIPVVVVALGSVSRWIGQCLEQIGIDVRIGLLQKTALLGTARILRKVFEN